MQSRFLSAIPDDELLLRLAALVQASRRTEADLVAHVAEVDARRLYLREAAPSMFVYCLERLHLSEAEACLRIAAARASREHPILLAMLADGRLHLSAIAKLAPHLTPGNREDLLRRATHKTRREIDELVAELAPRPDVQDSIRKLPAGRFVGRTTPADRCDLRALSAGERPVAVSDGNLDADPAIRTAVGERGSRTARTDRGASGAVSVAVAASSAGDVGPGGSPTTLPEDVETGPFRELVRIEGAASPRPERVDSPRLDGMVRWAAGPASSRAVIEPLAPTRYRVQFTASAELRDKLERLQTLMRSAPSGGDLAAVIEAAVTEKLERLEARRFGRAKAPRNAVSGTDTSPRTRQVPAAVKRAVHERDDGRCRYVDALGNRCTARGPVQYHHRVPFGVGGDHAPSNVALLCAGHNRYMAEIDYGREAVGRHRRASGPPPRPTPSEE